MLEQSKGQSPNTPEVLKCPNHTWKVKKKQIKLPFSPFSLGYVTNVFAYINKKNI